jgi:serine/threonine protein kinase
MKLLPHRRRESEEVKRTSYVLDDYANVLSRDSNFLASAAAGDTATVSSATLSLNESVHTSGAQSSRPSVVSLASVGSFQRQEVALGGLLGKGHFSKVYEIASIELNDKTAIQDPAVLDVDHLGDDELAEYARATMSKNAKAGKYAMKRLRKKLLRRPRDFTRAAANLVIEAQYLSKLDHPNILKLRGSALGGASSFQTGNHDGYFLILDRVTETLSERIHHTWAARRTGSKASVNEPELHFQKTHYALQLASAVHYLHDRRIIFRDLSPRNLGFTGDHSLQLFDFGLARDLPQALGLSNELFHMTQNAGSKPYAAVEVVTTGLYNLKADVYSFSMVIYEMMMEQVPFGHLAAPKSKKPFANKEFIQAVYIDGERPSFEATGAVATLPQAWQALLTKCWNPDLFHRPTMQDVFFELEGILASLPHKTKSLQLGMTPPAPVKVLLDETKQQHRLSLSDISNEEM